MKAIRCGRGLGDSIYLQSVVRHLIRHNGERYRVASDYPDVFVQLGDKIEVIPFRRNRIDIVAHYISRKGCDDTTQFRDCCINAGIADYPELRLDWQPTRSELVDKITAPGKPVVIVQLPRTPMGRTDGWGAELLPDCRRIQQLIDMIRAAATVVQVGAGTPLHEFGGIDIDLANATSVRELLDISASAAGFIGYCSFMLPLAESLHKPAIMVWSRCGLESKDQFIRRVTPKKMIEHASTRYLIDDCGQYEQDETLNAFLRQIKS